MSWIKIRKCIFVDPAVIKIARATSEDRHSTIGRLVAVWAWVDDMAATDVIPEADQAIVDELAGLDGFAAAMAAVGWIEFLPGGGVRIPNFDRHLSKGAKRRALGAVRQADWRSRNAPVTQEALRGVTHRALPDRGDETRGDESREDDRDAIERVACARDGPRSRSHRSIAIAQLCAALRLDPVRAAANRRPFAALVRRAQNGQFDRLMTIAREVGAADLDNPAAAFTAELKREMPGLFERSHR